MALCHISKVSFGLDRSKIYNKHQLHLTLQTSGRVLSQEHLWPPQSSAGSLEARHGPPSKELRIASTSQSSHLISNRGNCSRYWHIPSVIKTVNYLVFQVIVFIHGGAFILGSYTTYGPHHLLVTDERVTSSGL